MDIKIPEIGESITEGTISSWLKKTGDSIKFGDLLLELETDKVNLEITAESDGILEQINKQAGETVQVGETVGIIGAVSGREADSKEAVQIEPSPTHPIEEIKDTSEAEDSIVTTTPENNNEKAYSASPSVRKLAREKGINLNQFRPANPIEARRISHADIDVHTSHVPSQRTVLTSQYAEQSREVRLAEPSAAEKSLKSEAIDQKAVDPSRSIQRQRMSRRRITIAKRLVEAQRTAAMLTTFNEVDMTAILDVRKRRKQAFLDKHGIGLGFMSFFTKAVVGALKSFPLLNAEIDKEEILIKQFYDIGIAVSAKEGLVVPVIRGVDRLSFAEIERQIAELADKARSNVLALSDLQGGTFTITNGGVFGSLLSTPILNAPQVGILGMHTIQKRPIAVDDDKIVVRPMMYIALSYDHRIVDGSEAVRFLVTVKELLEDPESLLLEG